MPTETMNPEATVSSTPMTIAAAADYDSGWVNANNRSNNAMPFSHGLGVTPSQISVLFSADQETAFPVLWPWSNGDSGNPVTIGMNDRTIRLEITSGSPLHGAWSAATGKWTKWTQGFFRVFAWK